MKLRSNKIINSGAAPVRNQAEFVADITIPDGTHVLANDTIVKTWSLRNCGNTTWTDDIVIVHQEGSLYGDVSSIPVPQASPGEIVEVTVVLQTQGLEPGNHRSVYRITDANGPLGTLWCQIILIPNYVCKSCSNSACIYADNTINNDTTNNKVVISKKYNLRSNKNRTNNGIVQIAKYFLERVADDYSDTNIICDKCQNNIINVSDIKSLSRKLIKSIYVTKLFEMFISKDYHEDFNFICKNENFKHTLRLKLKSFYNNTLLAPIDYYWKGSNYYYKQIFGIDIILEDIIPIEIYNKRNELFLNDAICGHPMASDG